MDDVKIDAKSLYKLTNGLPCSQISEIFENRLPPELNIFAKQKTGAGYYTWQIPGEGWEKLSDADSVEADEVRGRLAEIKDGVRSALADLPKIRIDNVFKTPGDEYVFYKYDEVGKLIIRLAAWDYKAKKINAAGPVRVGLDNGPEKQKVVLAFTMDGSPSPGQEFSFKTYYGKKKRFVADENGDFDIGLLHVGKDYEVAAEGESFVIKPEKGKEIYPISITKDEIPESVSLETVEPSAPKPMPEPDESHDPDPAPELMPEPEPEPVVSGSEPVRLLFSANDSFGHPLSCRTLKFVQGNSEATLYLDASGCGSLERNTFNFGERIESSLIDSGVVKAKFNFTIEPDELEYRLEFSETIRKNWKRKLLDILFGLLLAMLVVGAWLLMMYLL